MSISDLQAHEGPVAVPLANASARPSSSESISAGHSDNSTATGHPASVEASHPNPAGKQPGQGTGQTASAPTHSTAASTGSASTAATQAPSAAPGKAPASASVAQAGPAPTPAAAASTNSGSGTANLGPVTHITLPKDGQFGVVVVGSSLADKYPETVGIWNGRPVYTVYLHVGSGKNWILQYSIPPAAGDTSARPDAPWPYDIVRPHFDPDDFTSDALMVHGFVATSGRFERLSLVFPDDFAKAKLLLSALQQWEFRPARQNGQVAAVEVLLIIPEESE